MIKNLDALWMKATACRVEPKGDGRFQVFSPSGGIYDVEIAGKDIRSCNCEYGQYHGRSACCHVLAAAAYRAVELGFAIEPVMNDEAESWREREYDKVFNIGQGVLLLGLSLETRYGEPA